VFLRYEVFHDRVAISQNPSCLSSLGGSICEFTLDGSTSIGDAQIFLSGENVYDFQIWGIENVDMTLDRTILKKIGDTKLYQTTNIYVRGIWIYSDTMKTSSVTRSNSRYFFLFFCFHRLRSFQQLGLFLKGFLI
jgi:hypothetical protein